ncbi:MAG: diacylglycerol kinase family protein [Gemmatimonadota bacterium]
MPSGSSLLIVNPAAGGVVDPQRIVDEIHSRNGCPVRTTSEAGDARRFAREAAEAGTEVIWVAGGDGTLHEVVLGLRDATTDPRPVLQPLPLGTGNDLIRSLEIPLDWAEAVAALAESSRSVALNLMDVTLDGETRVGMNAVIVGNGGRVGEVLDAEGKSWWGPLAYLRAGVEVALELEPQSMELTVDGGEPREERVLNVVVANGRYAGHGIPIAPGAEPDDDVLELVTVTDTTLPEALRVVSSLLAERDPEHDAYRHQAVTSVTLRAVGPDPLPVSVDGENTEARRIQVSLATDRVSVRVPE